MPELKPCPACGSDNVECLVCTINADENQDIHFHIACEDCYTSGPIANNGTTAKEMWNSLPRALTWSNKPPKVLGWYWWRGAKYQEHICIYVRDGLIVEYPRKVLRPVQDIGGQWAGPIVAPGE